MPGENGTRVTLVMGKGGVGRSTVAAALALHNARHGERIALLSPASTPGETRARLEGHNADADPLPPTLTILEPDSRALVDEIVRKLARLGPLSNAVLNHPMYDSLIGIVPGVREMALFNYVYNLRKTGEYDHVIVDAPATGHGIHFLEAPQKTMNLLVGKLKQRAQDIDALLKNTRVTQAIIVTLPEEMPVRETVELADKLRARDFPLQGVIVNKWLPALLPKDGPGTRTLAKLNADPEARRHLSRAIAHHTRVDVDEWLTAVNLMRGQHAEAERHLQALKRVSPHLLVIPFFPQASQRITHVANALHATPEAEAA